MNTDYSPNDIVPESYQMRLMMWRDEFTRGYFEIGDIANEIVMLNVQRGMKIDQNAIYAAIGKFCGKSGRTVRDYAEVSAFYPLNVRDEYDVLPFSHFRYAKSCGLRFREILDYSLDNPSMSAEALEAVFNCHGVAPQESVASPVGVASSPSSTPPTFTVAPPSQDVREIYALANLIAQGERLLTWKMDRNVHDELMVALDSLKHVLACLSVGEKIEMQFEYNQVECSEC